MAPSGPARDKERMPDAGAGVVGHHPGGGDPPDRVAVCVGEPQGPVRAGRDPRRMGDAGAGVVGDHPGGGDPPDRIGRQVGEPQRPVGAGRDPSRMGDAAPVYLLTTPAVVIRPIELL